MQQRKVTAPDGTKWNVGRRWLLHRPRYFGYRFGRERQTPAYEPATLVKVTRKPAPTQSPTPPPVRYTTSAPRGRRPRSTGPRWTWWSPRGSSGSSGRSGGISRSGGGHSRSFGGGSRSRSSGGGSRSRSSGGGKRGGGGGAAIGGLLSALVKVLKYALLAAAVVAVTLFVIFVAIPGLVFIAHYLAFWIVVGTTIVYRALTGRPWIIELEEAYGYRVRSWRVYGWSESQRAIDEIADAVRAGLDPVSAGAEEVEIDNA